MLSDDPSDHCLIGLLERYLLRGRIGVGAMGKVCQSSLQRFDANSLRRDESTHEYLRIEIAKISFSCVHFEPENVCFQLECGRAGVYPFDAWDNACGVCVWIHCVHEEQKTSVYHCPSAMDSDIWEYRDPSLLCDLSASKDYVWYDELCGMGLFTHCRLSIDVLCVSL